MYVKVIRVFNGGLREIWKVGDTEYLATIYKDGTVAVCTVDDATPITTGNMHDRESAQKALVQFWKDH